MEKDIEYRIKRFLDECEDGNWYWDDGVDAIENLIKGYRELEAKLNQLLKYEDDLRIKERAFCKENHIPKSKIREKIEELEKKILEYEAYRERGKETDVEYYDFIANSARKKVLQELMEDK